MNLKLVVGSRYNLPAEKSRYRGNWHAPQVTPFVFSPLQGEMFFLSEILGRSVIIAERRIPIGFTMKIYSRMRQLDTNW